MNLPTQLITVAVLFALGIFAERLAHRPSGDFRRILYGGTYVVIGAATNVVAVFLCARIAETTGLYRLIDLPISSSGVLGSLISLLALMFIADFMLYWMHRAQHSSALLWRAHALHHSDEDVGVTSTTRLHVIDVIGRHVFFTIPFPILFGLPSPEYAILLLIPTSWIYFIHLNINIGFGRAWWVMTSPQYHRIHHSLDPAHHDRNFATFFPVWDICFGTAYDAPADLFPPVGTHVPDVKTFSEYFTYPILPFWKKARQE